MIVIVCVNNKGGVGKTSASVHTAAGLSIRGWRTMVIDADAQGHATVQLGFKKWGGLYRLLAQEDEWKKVVAMPDPAIWAGEYPIDGQGKLYLLPGNRETRAISQVLDLDREAGLLRERLKELEKAVDVVLIDTSPTASPMHVMAYAAADYVIFPTEATSLALDGLSESRAQLIGVNEARQKQRLEPAKLLGILPTKVRNTAAHKYGLELLNEEYDVEAIMPHTSLLTVWEDAMWAKKLLYAYAPEHHATEEMWAIVDRVQQIALPPKVSKKKQAV